MLSRSVVLGLNRVVRLGSRFNGQNGFIPLLGQLSSQFSLKGTLSALISSSPGSFSHLHATLFAQQALATRPLAVSGWVPIQRDLAYKTSNVLLQALRWVTTSQLMDVHMKAVRVAIYRDDIYTSNPYTPVRSFPLNPGNWPILLGKHVQGL